MCASSWGVVSFTLVRDSWGNPEIFLRVIREHLVLLRDGALVIPVWRLSFESASKLQSARPVCTRCPQISRAHVSLRYPRVTSLVSQNEWNKSVPAILESTAHKKLSNLSKRTNRCRSNCSHKQIPETFFTAIHAVMTSLCPVSKQLLWQHITHPASHEVRSARSALTKTGWRGTAREPPCYLLSRGKVCFPLSQIYFLQFPVLTLCHISWYPPEVSTPISTFWPFRGPKDSAGKNSCTWI